MKTKAILPILTGIALTSVSCDRHDSGLEEKLSRLEQAADQANQRQAQLEQELAQNKIAAESEAIERERAEIERQRQDLEDTRNEEDAAAVARAEAEEEELAERQRVLEEKEEQIAANRADLEQKRLELTGLEKDLDQRELEDAGREPIPSLTSVNVVSQGAPTGDYENFYEPLAQYGSWFETSDYGYVYQPAAVRESSWRPYTRGRWAFTDQGWTWVSDEPFGWATYHYGRWTLLNNTGWVWVPGNEWAPAWVSWRENPDYVGWAPLPPETVAYNDHSYGSSVDVTFGIGQSWFSFVSYRNFGSDIRSHYLPFDRNRGIYDSSHNITHYSSRDNRVFVGGPRYGHVSDRIGRRFPIHRLRVDQHPRFGRGGRDFHPRFDGRELRVAAPRMNARWNQDLRPQRVRGSLGNVTVARSRDISQDARQRFERQRLEERAESQRAVREMGGRSGFQRARQEQLEQARRAESDARRRGSQQQAGAGKASQGDLTPLEQARARQEAYAEKVRKEGGGNTLEPEQIRRRQQQDEAARARQENLTPLEQARERQKAYAEKVRKEGGDTAQSAEQIRRRQQQDEATKARQDTMTPLEQARAARKPMRRRFARKAEMPPGMPDRIVNVSSRMRQPKHVRRR